MRRALPILLLCLVALAAAGGAAASKHVHGALSGSIRESVQEHPTTAISLTVKGKKIKVTSAALYMKCSEIGQPALTPTISTPASKIKHGTFHISGRMQAETSVGPVDLLYDFQGSVLKKKVVGEIQAETFIQNGSERCDDESSFSAS
jgi:hypothetical protein